MATKHDLTVNIDHYGGVGVGVEGVRVDMTLQTLGGDILDFATASDTDFVKGGVVASGKTDASGQLVFELVPTAKIKPASMYEAAIDLKGGGRMRYLLKMPDQAANLAELVRD